MNSLHVSNRSPLPPSQPPPPPPQLLAALPLPLNSSPPEDFQKWLQECKCGFGPKLSPLFVKEVWNNPSIDPLKSQHMRQRGVEALLRAKIGERRASQLYDNFLKYYKQAQKYYSAVDSLLYWQFNIKPKTLDKEIWIDYYNTTTTATTCTTTTPRDQLKGITVEDILSDPFTTLIRAKVASFPYIDKIWRGKMKGSTNSPSRVWYGFLHVMMEIMKNKGHTMVPKEMVHDAMKELKLSADDLPWASNHRSSGGGTTRGWHTIHDDLDGKECYILDDMKRMEEYIAKILLRVHANRIGIVLGSSNREKEELMMEGLDEDQVMFSKEVPRGGVVLMSGGPGSGKTKAVARALGLNPNCRLLTPTGMAQSNLRRKIDEEYKDDGGGVGNRRGSFVERISTAHRFILEVYRDRRNGSYADVVTDVRIDEASMIGTHLLYHISNAVGLIMASSAPSYSVVMQKDSSLPLMQANLSWTSANQVYFNPSTSEAITVVATTLTSRKISAP